MRRIDKKITVGMPQDLYDAIRALAEEDRRSIPSYIRLVLKDHVKQEEALTKAE